MKPMIRDEIKKKIQSKEDKKIVIKSKDQIGYEI
jgi:hypothetical protein